MKRLLKTLIFRAARANLDKKTVIVINKCDSFFFARRRRKIWEINRIFLKNLKINTERHFASARPLAQHPNIVKNK